MQPNTASAEEPLTFGHLGTKMDCPDYEGVLVSGVEDVLWQSMENHWVPVACPY